MAGRKGDITMVVAQDNRARTLTLESIDESMGKVQPVLGYTAHEMIGQPFRKFLPSQIDEQIEDYLEFDPAGRDFADVLSRCRNFGLNAKNGQAVKFKMRVQRDVSMDANARFLILMRGEDKVSEGVLKELAQLREYGEVDAVTDLVSAESFLKAARIVQEGVRQGNTLASLAIIEIDNFARTVLDYGSPTADGLLKEVAMRCVQTFRDADVVSYAGEGRFGVILLEADLATSQIPLQRLRSVVANQPLYIPGNEGVAATLSIAFRQMKAEDSGEDTIAKCEESLSDNQGKGNQVYSV